LARGMSLMKRLTLGLRRRDEAMKKLVITYNDLLNMDACSTQLNIFQEVFGNEVAVTKKNIQRAIENDLHVTWLMDKHVEYKKKLLSIYRPKGALPVGTKVKIKRDQISLSDYVFPGWVETMESAAKRGLIRPIEDHTIGTHNGKVYFMYILHLNTDHYFFLPEWVTPC
jgi:hypothetical protein